MWKSRTGRVASAVVGTLALLAGSILTGEAQIPPGTINLPITVSVPPESLLPISDVVVFDGSAAITSDNANGLMVGCPLGFEPDNPAAVDLVGCGGTFTSSSAICEFVSDPGEPDLPGVGAPEGGGCEVTFNGLLENLVCGTGTLQANISFSGGLLRSEQSTGVLGIVLVATVGVITGYLNDGDYIVGLVQLGPPLSVPPPLPPDTGDCMTGVTFIASALMFDL
jgi:hypothetical protein